MRHTRGRYRKANAVALAGILEPVIERLGCGPQIRLDMLRTGWEDIVGVTNARNTTPHTLADGVLTVAVSSPAWMTQARFMKTRFLDTVNRHLASAGRDGITDITFTLEQHK